MRYRNPKKESDRCRGEWHELNVLSAKSVAHRFRTRFSRFILNQIGAASLASSLFLIIRTNRFQTPLNHPNEINIMKRKLPLLITCLAAFGFVGGLQGSMLFSDSFDYGSSTTNIGSVGNWSSGSSVLKYDHDGGLTHPSVGGATGGSMWLDFNDARSASNSTDFTSLDLTTLGQGDTVWMTSIFQYVAGNSSHGLTVSGGSVSEMGFSISGAGNVSVVATLNTTVNATNGTGINLTSGTYMMLARYTKGSGTSPNDSAVDLWINPPSASSVSALGTADWTLDSSDGDVKWGRDGNSLTGLTDVQPSQQGRIDEIRMATTFSELNLVPEPSAALFGGFALLALMLRRRR